MNILILGGTVFLGRALVEAGRARGHRLTLFNRGRSAPSLYPDVEQVHGDRERDLSLLDRRKWDAVIDTCGYLPRIVRISARRLAEKVGSYVFISTLSVYATNGRSGIDEEGSLVQLENEGVEEITAATYGGLKVLCEREVQCELPAHHLIVRPGLIVGPNDPTDRFTYWPARMTRGGEVLAPGRPLRSLQFIDVRDLAGWIIRGMERGLRGVYNANGPSGMCTMRSLLETCRQEAGGQSEITWVEESFLTGEGVVPWSEIPLWIPESDPEAAGFYSFSSRKAIAEGLVIRPLSETVRSVLDWLPLRPDRPWRAGLSAERERQLLQKYASQRGQSGDQAGFKQPTQT